MHYGRDCTTAEAIRECAALVWDARTFKDLVERLPVLQQNMTPLICGQLQELEERFRELATGPSSRALLHPGG